MRPRSSRSAANASRGTATIGKVAARANHRIEPLRLGFVVCEHQQIELPPLCVLLLFHHCLRQSESFPTKAMKIRAVHQ
jgi:hypothetical protein